VLRRLSLSANASPVKFSSFCKHTTLLALALARSAQPLAPNKPTLPRPHLHPADLTSTYWLSNTAA